MRILFFCNFLLAYFVLQSLQTKSTEDQFIINLQTAEMQVHQAENIYKAGQFEQAEASIAKLRPMLSQFTELHSQLYEAIKDDPSAKISANLEKKQTIAFAKLRDRVNYLAGLISVKQGNNREAVKHFVQVVSSQRTTGLGEQSYNQIRNLGFSPKLTIKDQI